MNHRIEPGQIYRSCDPRGGPRIRITHYLPDCNRADVVDATTGKRPRGIIVRHLHATATTKTGQPRRTGYALEES